MYGNTEFIHLEVYFGFFAGSHSVQLEFDDTDAQADLAFGGVKLFSFCDGLEVGAESVLTTLKAFVGGLGLAPSGIRSSHVPAYQEDANIDFMCEAFEYCMKERPVAS
jgi:hypothetical protein